MSFPSGLRSCRRFVESKLHSTTPKHFRLATTPSIKHAMAVRIPASVFWGGIEGNWSTFAINVGDPPQSVNVLMSTSGAGVRLPTLASCAQVNATGFDCAVRRGGVYQDSNSTTYTGAGLSTLSVADNISAIYGTDKVTLGSSGQLSLPREMILEYTGINPFLGTIGLSGNNISLPWDTPSNKTLYSLLNDLRSSGQIPSKYFGYQPGAWYRGKGTAGSLTVGGYDSSRGNEQNVLTVPMSTTGAAGNNSLLVQLQGIDIGAISGPPGLPLNALLDSSATVLWLPLTTCEFFEKAFNLTWDSGYQVYIVDEASHTRLLKQNASLTFALTIPGSAAGANTTNITLPYAAFDSQASYPYLGIANGTYTRRYFPLKRTDTSFVLGRPFLQEVYLGVDWDRREFNVSQALWPESSKPQLQTVVAGQYEYAPISKSGLSGGAIAGVVIALLAGLALISYLIFLCLNRRKANQKSKEKTEISRPQLVEKPTFYPAEPSTYANAPQESRYEKPLQTRAPYYGASHEQQSPYQLHYDTGSARRNGPTSIYELDTPDTSHLMGAGRMPVELESPRAKKMPVELESPVAGRRGERI